LSAVEKDRPDVVARTAEFKREIASIDPRDLFFVDEAGSHIAMTRTHARSPVGQRAHGKVPRCRGTVTTTLAALTLSGIAAVATIEGATDAPVFTAFVEQVLAPQLHPGAVVVLDNLGAHRAKGVREAVEAEGARLLFQPQYSPELNPIEEAWAKVKGVLRSMEPRDLNALDAAVAAGCDAITPDDAIGYMRHAGYRIN
jgi:transposase